MVRPKPQTGAAAMAELIDFSADTLGTACRDPQTASGFDQQPGKREHPFTTQSMHIVPIQVGHVFGGWNIQR